MAVFLALSACSLLVLSGCTGSADRTAHSGTVTVTRTETATVTETVAAEPSDVAAVLDADRLSFDGDFAAIEYPSDWSADATELWKGSATDGYFDTTIRSDDEPDVMVRIDVTPAAFRDPQVSAAQVEKYLVPQRGYRRIAFEPATFAGYGAFRWDFAVIEHGVLLRKSDIFFTTSIGDSYAVLVQAPQARQRALRRLLNQIRASVVVPERTDEASNGLDSQTTDEAAFCETHRCIDYFDEGVGSIVECSDGMWSHSGGRQGACSHHGGVAGGSVGSSGDSFGYDTNDDGSPYNWCGATRDGDGDGLWCEGR